MPGLLRPQVKCLIRNTVKKITAGTWRAERDGASGRLPSFCGSCSWWLPGRGALSASENLAPLSKCPNCQDRFFGLSLPTGWPQTFCLGPRSLRHPERRPHTTSFHFPWCLFISGHDHAAYSDPFQSLLPTRCCVIAQSRVLQTLEHCLVPHWLHQISWGTDWNERDSSLTQ